MGAHLRLVVHPKVRSLTAQWQSRVRLVDEVVAVLRDRVYSGVYRPGTRLLQDQLATELGISRTPLREALRMLEQEGLVRMQPGKGVRVVSGDVPALLAAYEVRRVMDGLAARLAAQHADPSGLKALEDTIDAQQKALSPWTPESYTAANVEFHAQIMVASSNEFVVAQMSIVRMTAQVFTPVAVVERTRAGVAVAQHLAILEAITAGDGSLAESLAMEHIQTTIDALRSGMDADKVPANPSGGD